MDGALIGFHNTSEHFGFEYIKTSFMEKVLFGTQEKADVMFPLYSLTLTRILDQIVEFYQNETFEFLRLGQSLFPIL